MPVIDQIVLVVSTNPHVAVPFGAVVAEWLILFAARRDVSGLIQLLTVAEITAFAAAATIMAAGSLPETFLTSRMPSTAGPWAIFGYAFVLPFLWLSQAIRPQPIVSRLEYVGRYLASVALLFAAIGYFWASLFLAAALP